MSTTSSSTNVNIPFGLPEDGVQGLDRGEAYTRWMKRGPASQIVDLVEELKKIKGVVEPGLKGLLGKRTSTPEVGIDSIKREKLEAERLLRLALMQVTRQWLQSQQHFPANKKQKTILNGRPFEQTGPPVVLFHPVFGEFIRDMDDQSLVIPDKTYQLTEDFLWASAEFYDDEDARKTTIKKILGKIWGHIGSANFGKRDCSSDGVLITNINESVAYRMILEFKNEVGTGGTDPTLQTALYYRGYRSQDDAKSIRDLCCCPTFGVAIAGPWMCILGAVLLDKTVVQLLTPFLPLTETLYDDKHVGRVSRILVALGRAFDKLQMFYTGLTSSSVDGQQRYFPHFRQFVDSAGTPVAFTYLSQLTERGVPDWCGRQRPNGISA
ncbi:7119_t:CDS:2 [Paraglomus occultum]|uniref:7119_t:CDS:1 n=1 Tax=Paraglomus occultum TaxID=144539 RepID=A0A9N9B2D0_9GLOM|nr:7119_t:CDS:2 [Paraglomus occultum]